MKPSGRRKSFSGIEARQRNIVWPDTLRNGALVDAFLWKGSPDATPTQRIGIALFGFLFLCPAVLLVGFGCFEQGGGWPGLWFDFCLYHPCRGCPILAFLQGWVADCLHHELFVLRHPRRK